MKKVSLILLSAVVSLAITVVFYYLFYWVISLSFRMNIQGTIGRVSISSILLLVVGVIYKLSNYPIFKWGKECKASKYVPMIIMAAFCIFTIIDLWTLSFEYPTTVVSTSLFYINDGKEHINIMYNLITTLVVAGCYYVPIENLYKGETF